MTIYLFLQSDFSERERDRQRQRQRDREVTAARKKKVMVKEFNLKISAKWQEWKWRKSFNGRTKNLCEKKLFSYFTQNLFFCGSQLVNNFFLSFLTYVSINLCFYLFQSVHIYLSIYLSDRLHWALNTPNDSLPELLSWVLQWTEDLGSIEYPFFAITPRSTMTQSCSTC